MLLPRSARSKSIHKTRRRGWPFVATIRHGGMAAVKDASPTSQLGCHAGDRALIENRERLYQDRYSFLSHDHGLRLGREGMVYSPRRCKIDVNLSANGTL
jgi:hypothetical protein